MRLNLLIITTLAATSLAFMSCSSSDDVADNGTAGENTVRYPVEISVSEAGTRAAATRAVDYTGSNLGLSILYNKDYADAASRTNVRWENIPHNGVVAWAQTTEGTRPMQWKNPTDSAAILAFAPYQSVSSAEDLKNLNIDVRRHQEYGLDSSDFVSYYNPAFVPGDAVQKIPIVFNHQLCKLSIDLVAKGDRYIAGLDTTLSQQWVDSLAQVKVGPVNYKATYNLSQFLDGKQGSASLHPVTTIVGEPSDTDSIYCYVANSEKRGHQECILPPQTIKKDSVFLQILINNEEACKHHIFIYRPNREYVLEPGKDYHLTLELSAPTLSNCTITISDWIQGGSSSAYIGW